MAGPLDLKGRVVITDGGALGYLGRLKGALNAVGNVHRSVANTSRNIGRGTAGAGGFGTAAFGAMFLKNAYDFDKALRFASATADRPVETTKALRAEVERLAEAYPLTRKQIMQGAQEFITAGNDVERTTRALELLTHGAIASGQEVGKVGADVTDVVAAMFGAVRDEQSYAKRVEEVLNVMAVGASTANHTWQEQTLAMQYSAPVARALGIELKTLTAMIGVLADNGFKGEKGGSALRTILLNLRAPTARAAAAFKDLGIDVEKAFKFNDAKALDGGKLLGRLTSMYGELGPEVGAAIDKTMADGALRSDLGQMRDVLIRRVAKAMNIDSKDALSLENLAQNIDRHFKAAVDNFDPNYLFEKLDAATADQMRDITGVRRTPQLIALAKGFTDQFLPKLERIAGKVGGALERRMGIFLEGYANSIDRLVSSLDVLSSAFEKSGLLSDLVSVFDGVRDWVNMMRQADPELLRWIGRITLLAGALSILGFVIAGIALAFATLLNPIVLIGAALGYIAYEIVSWFGGLQKFGTWLSELWQGFADGWNGLVASVHNQLASLKSAFSGFGDWLQGALLDAFLAPVRTIINGINTVRGLLGFEPVALTKTDSSKPMSGVSEDTAKSLSAKPASPKADVSWLPGFSSLGANLPIGTTTSAPSLPTLGAKSDTGQSDAAVQSARAASAEIRSIFASINLQAEGERIMAELAAGIQAGGAQAISAANRVAAGVRSATSGVHLNTGPNMQPAN